MPTIAEQLIDVGGGLTHDGARPAGGDAV